jgi:serine/threonine protein kinase/tetratricopeptide (TPR) repeat protein
MIGTRLGPYRVTAELGAGGMGTVWLAEVEGEAAVVPRGTRVAIKVVHPHLLGQPKVFKRFMREAEVGRQVDHQNVVRTFEVDVLEVEEQTAHFLVMEYVEGRTLRALLKDLGTVPEALLRELARQVASGLSAIHDAGVVHRDLKPENVLVTDDHEVRIMDLGVARLVETSVVLTRSGEFAGSFLYAAPEQFREEAVGPLADLYSLGVMLYEMATGDNPFRRDSVGQVIAAHLDETPRSATEVGAELSPFFGVVLSALLAKRPEERFESAASLQKVLEQGERSDWWAERESELLRARSHLPQVPVRRETELYGRETELETLRHAWTKAREGEGNTILLEGEAGIGKTRLVDTFLKSLPGEEVHVLYGSYSPSGGMGGISDAITDHFGLVGIQDALRPYLQVTPSLVPAFAAMVKHESPPTDSEPIQGDAVHAVYVHLMRGLAEEKPLVWVIDDLHFSDPDSRKIVLSLARAVEGHRILLLTTTRPGLPGNEQAHFSHLANHRRVDLGRLSPREVMLLLRGAFKSEALADRLAGKIAYKSDGVPFFVFEVIRGLREGQLIKELPDGTWIETRIIEEIEVPSAVKDLIEARLGDVSDEDRALLDICAVQGFEFDPILTARVREMKPVAVLERLAAIERTSGVIRSGAGCRFDHHQIQEVVYEGLMPDLRREYHALLAEVRAERIEGEPTGEDAIFLATHHMRGSRAKNGAPHLTPALTHLAAAYRNDAAIALATRALSKPDLLKGEDRVEVLLAKAGGHALLGQRPDQRLSLDEALDLADEAGGAALRAKVRNALGAHLDQTADPAAAEEGFTQAIGLAREAANEALEATAERGLGLVYLGQGRLAESRPHTETSLALARELGIKDQEASSTLTLGLLQMNEGETALARRTVESALVMARDCGRRGMESRASGTLAWILANSGSYDDAREGFERTLRIAREIGDRPGEATATGNLGTLHMSLGRYERAWKLIGEGLALANDLGNALSASIATGNLGRVLSVFGRNEEARTHLESNLSSAREFGHRPGEGAALCDLAAQALREGATDEALSRCAESLDVRRALGAKGPIAESLVTMAWIEVARGETESARARIEEARSLAREAGSPSAIVASTVEAARLPGGDVEAAIAALNEHEDRLGHGLRMDARFRLWELTGDPVHLGEAHRLLEFGLDNCPEEYRESMVAEVPLHRDIMAAWEEHGG